MLRRYMTLPADVGARALFYGLSHVAIAKAANVSLLTVQRVRGGQRGYCTTVRAIAQAIRALLS